MISRSSEFELNEKTAAPHNGNGSINNRATAPDNTNYTMSATNFNQCENFGDAALHYVEKGLPVFPLRPQTKIPATAHGFLDATTDPDRILEWGVQNPNYNIALATGKTFVVIDEDGRVGMESVMALEQKLGELPPTVTQITPGKIKNGQHTGTGRHLFFKTKGQKFSCRVGIAEGIDIRADGGYIVVAPSVHPDGTGIYGFVEGHSFDDIEPAELPPDWVEFLQADAPKKKTATVGHKLPPASEVLIEACRQEIAACDPAMAGDGGDKQTFTVACKIFYDFGLSESEGRSILEEYNRRCVPPWDAKALQHKIDCAITHSNDKPRGWKRSVSPIEGEYYPSFGAVVLNPSRTLPSATAFRWANYNHTEGFILRYYAGDFYCWSGSHYQQVSMDSIKGELLNWLSKATMLRNDKPIRFPANSKNVNDVLEALKTVCLLVNDIKSGTWLGDKTIPLPSNPIFAQNCVYDWQTGTKYPCSPNWFNLSRLNTVIEDDVLEPKRWLQFLNELWGNDQASKDLLHEFMGLTLTLDTSFQKILLLLGPLRAGKGTMTRVWTAIHGQENVAAPSTGSLVQNFGLQSLLGKPLAIISDARFAGQSIQVAIERLLNISGEDSMVVDQKYRSAVTVKLPTRLIIASNELPRLPDNAGALANRFLILRLTRSFLNNEDRGLEAALLQELPGIVKLMIDGLRRLYRQGFTRTSYQATTIQSLEEFGSPIRAFLRECCVVRTGLEVSVDMLYAIWLQWCETEGQQCTGRSIFGRNLKTCLPDIVKIRRITGTYYSGIGLRSLDIR